MATYTTVRTLDQVFLPGGPVTVVCGGDPDGSLAGGLTSGWLRRMGVEVSGVRFERSVPFNNPPTGAYCLVDIPVDGRMDPREVIAWLQGQAENIFLVVDHHQGDECYHEALGGSDHLICGDAPSCPALLQDRGMEVDFHIVDAANYCDDPTGGWPETDDAQMFRRAFDVGLVDFGNGNPKALLDVEVAFVNMAIFTVEELERGGASWVTHFKAFDLLVAQAARWERIQMATGLAAAAAKVIGYSEVAGRYVIGAAVGEGRDVANTTLLMALYKQEPIAVVLTRTPQGEALTIVAHNLGKGGPNLVQLLGLTAGNPSRVPLVGEHAGVMARIKAALQIS